MAVSELMDHRLSRFLAAARHFADLLSALPIPAGDRVEIASQGQLLMSALNLLTEEPARRGANEELQKLEPIFDRSVALLERNLRRFQRDLLLGDEKPFDEDAFGRRLAGASLEDLLGLLSTLDEGDKDLGLDDIEKSIEGLGELNLPGRVARIKALIMLLIELLVRVKGIPGAEQIRRIIRQLLKQIDKLAGSAPTPQTPMGGEMVPTPGPTTTPTPSTSGTPAVEPACFIDVYLREITAEGIDNTGNNWQIELQVGEVNSGTIVSADPNNSFDKSTPARFQFRAKERSRRTIISQKGCGRGTFNIRVIPTQGSNTADSTFTIDYVCGQREINPCTIRVVNSSLFGGGKVTTLTLVFEVVTTCSTRAQGDD